LRIGVPETRTLTDAMSRADSAYRNIAVILVALRHEFRTAEGKPDLKGRSHEYRATVRDAYFQAGAKGAGPIEKRLTAGVSYWVRKLLIERYGEDGLRDLGIVSTTINDIHGIGTTHHWQLPENVEQRLPAVVGLLNDLATDPRIVPTESLVRAAVRAVHILHRRLGRPMPNGSSAGSRIAT
jgi:hypothetical protein